ncbi:MAG: hypothetical protein KF729_02275 [Sandaracinaceae bacterium]|nr:hypothetical protein [Sandaracinaceae bacterium]
MIAPSRRGVRVALTLALALCPLASGCDGAAPADAGAREDAAEPGEDAGAPIPDVLGLPALDAANAVAPGHPLFEGQQRFLWDAMGTERVADFPPTAFFEAWLAEEPGLFDRFGFLDDPNDDLPIGFKRGLEDPTHVQSTCALCHVARLPDGRLWLGAPSTRLDWGAFRLAVDDRWIAQGNAAMLTPAEREKLTTLGPGRTNAASSAYPRAVPADFPPYFRLGARTALNYLGTGGNLRTEVYLSVFTSGAGSPNPREAVVPWPPEARLDPMIAAMGAFEAPSAPAGDAARIAQGRAVYEREGCDACHHAGEPSALGVTPWDELERAPGEDAAWPRGSIATSRAHRVLVDGDGEGGAGSDTGYRDLIAFISRHGLSARPSDGYRAADLGGLWVTAPYLHNGSVPTLDALLRPPAERPATFERDGFVVDTTVEGNGNQGHAFGTSLSDDERAALIAYLESL